ncbi:ABC transporter ATP-binding protein [Dactylosporangium cerinum]|uniref:ABC transporter ATP-binding protein n=1 Tax=Dactylosporangium cerinum TaxID=1434730 RepID=A0ABV9W643_9ACTN
MTRPDEGATGRRGPSWWPAVVAVGRARPGLAAVAVSTTLLSAAVPALFIILSGTAAGLLARRDDGSAGSLGLVVAAMAVVLALSQLSSMIRSDVLEALARQMDMVLRRRLIEAVARPVGLGHLEDPRLQGRIATAHGLANRLGGPAGGLLGVTGRIQVLLTAVGCVALLAWVDPVLAAVSGTLHLVVGWWLRDNYRQLLHHLHLDPGALRRGHYLRDLLLRPGAEKETRVFGLGRWLLGLHHTEWLRVSTAAWQGRRIAWWKIAAGAVLLGAGQAAGIAVLADDWQDGAVSLAALVVGVQAGIGLLQFAAVTEWDRLAHIGWDAVDALVEVEDAVRPAGPTGDRDPGAAPLREIELRDVSFSYPDGTQVLHGISMTVPAGGSLAIVGRNGAGKSTLLKLLLRSHEPTSGEILVDGVPLRELDPQRWRSRLATMTQNFVRLPLTVRENVAGPGRATDARTLAAVAAQSDLDTVLADLPHGWDTVLSPQLAGGTDLSGGQWQKVALARGLHALRTGATVLALDEPTANMDIEAERAVYDAIIDATREHTLLLVSHRFATVRRVDRIVVLDAGRIVETGDHATLIQQGGLYAQMFDAQAAIVR